MNVHEMLQNPDEHNSLIQHFRRLLRRSAPRTDRFPGRRITAHMQ